MKLIIELKHNVRMFPYCPLWTLDDYQGNIKLERSDGTHTYANYYCPCDKNPYIGQGLYYVHHKKPAFLTRFGDHFVMGTKKELEKLLEVWESN